MKKILSVLLSALMLASCLSVSFGASAVNEPTTEDLEKIIKIVKPKLNVPENYSQFTWRYNSKTAYSDASWRFTWATPDESEVYSRIITVCDEFGNITSYTHREGDRIYGQLPVYSKDDMLKTAEKFLSDTIPEAYENLKFSYSVNGGIYSGQYNYVFERYIDGYVFSDNFVDISVDYLTCTVTQMNVNYDYDVNIERHENIITPEKAAEILGTRQKMVMKYHTKSEVNEETGERTIKAFLVYSPETSYLAVDAGTGEIYDAKSSWSVKGDNSTNGSFSEDAAESEGALKKDEGGYELTEEEKAGVKELEGLISKEEAIRAVTENEYLYVNPSLTAVDASLSKNYNNAKTSYYQNDNGAYIWRIDFSNPVIENKYYDYAYAYATVNAETGQIISYECNLNDYYYYVNNSLEIPAVKYDKEQSNKIAESFLKEIIPEKFESSVASYSYQTNAIDILEHKDGVRESLYGAYQFGYNRVNEGIEFSSNHINVGVDGVTGKIYSFSYNWYTNVEFESPKGAITPEEALAYLLSFDGYGLNYEKNVVYIYTPITQSSKKDVSAAFTASLVLTLENGGDIEKVIDKYAEDIDREKLLQLLEEGNEDELLGFISEYYGVTPEETADAANSYVDSSEFYSKEVSARLVYSCYDVKSSYVSPFTGKQVSYSGEEYVDVNKEYTYSDLEGHWIEKSALLLADIGIGFEGGKFEPDKTITGNEFIKLAQAMSLYTQVDENASSVMKIEAVRSILNYFGFEKVASLKGIYKTEFSDNSDIKEDDIGYIAIANGLGIVKGDGVNVNAYSELTRAQAVSLLVNALNSMR